MGDQVQDPVTEYQACKQPSSLSIFSKEIVDSAKKYAPDHSHKQAVGVGVILEIQVGQFGVSRIDGKGLNSQKHKNRPKQVQKLHSHIHQGQGRLLFFFPRQQSDGKMSDKHEMKLLR